MKLRIAHVTATFPPYRGGTGNVCYHNARELARRGHEVHVFTAAVPGAAAREDVDGALVHRLRPLAQVGNAPVLPGLLSALRGFDVIHLHYPFILGAELVRLAALLYRTPLVISFHNDLIGDGARAHVFAFYQALSARLVVRGAAALGAVSLDHLRSSRLRRMLAAGQPPVVALPNGVDIEHFYPAGATGQVRARYGIPAAARLALFVAALDRAHHFKGFDRLLKAFQRLPADTWLLVVGDGDMRREYEAQARQLGVAGRVTFAGAVAQRDTPPFFCEADVTVLPSSPPESFGLVLIESLACGTPVIASDIPGVRTVVSHGVDGLLAEHGSVAGLTEALETLLTLPAARRREMGLAGRAKVAKQYHWEQIGARLEALYQKVLCISAPVLSEVQGES